jgi:hypothetical protein
MLMRFVPRIRGDGARRKAHGVAGSPDVRRRAKPRVESLERRALLASITEYPIAVDVQHLGSMDPSTEGFTMIKNQPSSNGTVGPVNDSGQAAWNVTSNSPTSQIYYTYGFFTPAQDTILSTQGFTLSTTPLDHKGCLA